MNIYKCNINKKLYTLYRRNIGLGYVIDAEPYNHYSPPPDLKKCDFRRGVNINNYTLVGIR